MNTLQFFYVHTVLGVSSVIQPKTVRSSYRLHHNSTEKPDFLFFSNQIKTKEEKNMIQKIAKAIGASQTLILEILSRTGLEKAKLPKRLNNTTNTQTAFHPLLCPVLDNLLTRFLPKGFVIFGPNMANHSTGKISRAVSLGEQKTLLVPGCVLSPISAFVGSDSLEVQKTKQQAWNLLQQTFPQ